MTSERWDSDRASSPVPPHGPLANAWPTPPLATAVGRGLRGLCPACGKGRIFQRFLKVAPVCPHCEAPLGLVRADDAPPYFTILLVGHIVVPLLFLVERSQTPPLWVMSAVFLPLTLLLTLALIQPIKGGTVGLMLNLNMLKPDPGAA